MSKQAMQEQQATGEAVLNVLQKSTADGLFSFPGEWLPLDRELELGDLRLYHVQELTFEEKAPRREAMENILGMFRGMGGISFVYLILGDSQGVHFYFGVAKDYTSQGLDLSVNTLGDDVLGPGILGNFRGSKIKKLENDEIEAVLNKIRAPHPAGILLGVPGTEKANKDNEGFQGVDRLIDVMAGDNFGFLVIARPYTEADMLATERQLLALFDALTPLARHTLQRTSSTSSRHSENQNQTQSEQHGEAVHHSKSATDTKNDSVSSSTTDNHSNQQASNDSQTATEQGMTSNSASVNETEGASRGSSHVNRSGGSNNSSEDHNNKDHRSDKTESANNSVSSSYGTNYQTSYTFSHQVAQTKTVNQQQAHSESMTDSETNDNSKSTMQAKTSAQGTETGESFARQEQMEMETKAASQWLKHVEENLLPRLDYGRGKGLFLSCAYLFTQQTAMLYRLANTAISLFSGPKGNQAALRFHAFHSEDDNEAHCEVALKNLHLPLRRVRDVSHTCATGLSLDMKGDVLYGGNWLSASELGILAGLPQKEVPGLALREEVDFGLNVSATPPANQIPLGKLVQDGNVHDKSMISLDRTVLDKHTFVTGVTGSGKTTTCQNILLGCDLPFLVIEPAKTEYRALAESCSDIIYFTLGLQDVAPFFLNPFEISPDETITSRADMIKATLEASFDMEAAIPQIMETAVYRAYEEKNWDIPTNRWYPDGNEAQNPFVPGTYAFPTLSDYWQAVQQVTKEQGFGERLQDEYMGSLKARLGSLLVGAKGMMLDTPRSVDFSDLVHRKVVIELEEIKNGSEKSLLMGFILTNLLQAVKRAHHDDPHFQHITLIEEAHRLLSRYVPGDSMNKKQGVEVFADMLAEVRKYGESLIIADQIPDKMTPEVLKNTNTKIVHKLFARDDKDAIGDTMALNDDQKAHLSRLPVGRAVMFSQGWEKAIQVQVDLKSKTTGVQEIEPEEIRQHSIAYYAEPQIAASGVLPGLEVLPLECNRKNVELYLRVMQLGNRALTMYREAIKGLADEGKLDNTPLKNFQREVLQLEMKEQIPRPIWQTWLYCKAYPQAVHDDVKRQDFLNVLMPWLEGDFPALRNQFLLVKYSVIL